MRQEVRSERDIIAALRHGLAERIGRDRFDLWFGSQVEWEVCGDTVKLTAPNPFLLDRLRRQFAPDIQLAVHTICGTPAKAELCVADLRPAACSGMSDVAVVDCEPAGANVLRGTIAAQTAAAAPRSSVATLTAPAMVPSVRLHSASEPRGDASVPRRTATLPSFIVGGSNRVAFTAAQSVVQRPGVVTPLFLYGPPGTGKSHLLEAICAAARAKCRSTRALLMSSEQFTCHFLEALQGSGLPNFRRKCRDINLLAIDDIQFFAGKKATLVEFQHTLDAVARQGGQVIVAADRAPAELTALGSELVARLTGGLVCGIESADYETRTGITRQFVERIQLAVPPDVVRMIALETSGDARQIRGALNRLQATSVALNRPITLELAQQCLSDIFAAAQRLVRLPDVERAVCEVFGMETKSLREGNKTKSVSQPRMLAMWLARKYTQAAFSEIGEYFGRRSHSTVISAERKVDQWVANGAKLQLGRSCWSVEEAIRRVETKIRTG